LAGKWSWRGGIFGDDGGIQQEFAKMTGSAAGQLDVNYPWTLGKRAFILPILRKSGDGLLAAGFLMSGIDMGMRVGDKGDDD